MSDSMHEPVPAGLLADLVELLGRYDYPVGDLAQVEESLVELAGRFRRRREALVDGGDVPAAAAAPVDAVEPVDVAEVAVPVEPVGPDPVNVERRVMRWQRVAEAVAVGLVSPPDEVRISDDGWSLDLLVVDEVQVRAWAVALGAGEVQVRVYSPGRGQVAREVYAEQTHPFVTRISCVEALPPVPPPARKQLAAAGFVAVAR